jgi:hypothetical protein
MPFTQKLKHMKKIYFSITLLLVILHAANAQLILNTQFINPCGGDEHNEFIVAKTASTAVNIADICFGSYNPSSNGNGVGGTAVKDYNYYWAGNNTAASPYPTFSNFPGESCGSGVSCYGFRYPSITADRTDINALITELNTVAGCNVFIAVPNTDIIPANSNVIIFVGAGFRGTSALCGFDNAATNLNFSNHCNNGAPLTTYYVVFGDASGSGPTCTNTGGGYFSNSSRRISALHVFNGGSNTSAANYTTSLQDYTPGSGSTGNAGIIVPDGAGGSKWVNNQGCVPTPNIILAIRLEYFKGLANNKKVTLNWLSAFEQDIKSFEIEKSLDGRNFYPLTSLQPANISGTQYSTEDTNPASGFNFYRLKVINLNGTVEYSAILKFNFTKGAASNWALYPNPVEGKTSITYQSFTNKQIWVSIADITGKTISAKSFNIQPGTNKLLIDAEKLSAAMYLLSIESDGSIETTSFIKK